MVVHNRDHPLLHIIHIIIFLFCTASSNLIAYYPLWAYAFYITGQLSHVLKVSFYTGLWVTAIDFIISAHLDDHEAIWMWPGLPIMGVYCIINYPNLLNISVGIPLTCWKLKLPLFRIERSSLHSIWTKVLQCGIEPGTSCITGMFIAHQSSMLVASVWHFIIS